ncbi:MAG TPA: YqgE/AlgH family protein [Macromonas sp.]|nr:YqgE/AlgH family protein [Macromonas sp.]
MPADTTTINLTNHFLIAMPGLKDELFGKSVVYLCEHNERGALGLIINKPSSLNVSELFTKVELPLQREDLKDAPVFLGGPLQQERGFVLHEPMGSAHTVGSDETPPAVAKALRDAVVKAAGEDEALQITVPGEAKEGEASDEQPAYASTMTIPGGLEMTTSRDVLEAISYGHGPHKVLMTLGYASWGEGQLESELGENSWLTVQADPAVIFDTPVAQRYERAMALLGLQPWMLAPGSGHA